MSVSFFFPFAFQTTIKKNRVTYVYWTTVDTIIVIYWPIQVNLKIIYRKCAINLIKAVLICSLNCKQSCSCCIFISVFCHKYTCIGSQMGYNFSIGWYSLKNYCAAHVINTYSVYSCLSASVCRVHMLVVRAFGWNVLNQMKIAWKSVKRKRNIIANVISLIS